MSALPPKADIQLARNICQLSIERRQLSTRPCDRCSIAARVGPKWSLQELGDNGMTTAIDSVELTRVGPGTVMGQLMREYWIPALMCSELVVAGRAPELVGKTRSVGDQAHKADIPRLSSTVRFWG